MKDSSGNPTAVAIDLGATSVRFAKGEFDGKKITYEIVEQLSHECKEEDGHPRWDVNLLLGFCRQATDFASTLSKKTTVGIDSWGVDHGFVDARGKLIQSPACYRDPAHQEIFEELKDKRKKLYELTGIAHQPFNTIYQLIARKRDDPKLSDRGNWLILPELFAQLLGCEGSHELTQSSTTQLMGLDGKWSPEAFRIAGWPVPPKQPELPGAVVGKTDTGVPVVRVGGHDTASAVCGMGNLEPTEAFLNVGTWSLLGCMLDKPLISPEAEGANFSNERAVDGRVRFLKNIPGFYVINRLHEELKITNTVPDWVSRADQSYNERIDLFSPDFFNPPSMLKAVRSQLSKDPPTAEAWAGVALTSLAEGAADQLHQLERITGRTFSTIRLAGGGSKSRAFCEALANVTSKGVLAGPHEATVLGNLGAQFLAQGCFNNWTELGEVLRNQNELVTYFPGV